MTTTIERPSDTTLVMKRTIKAPAADVYAAWTQPEILSKWFVGTGQYSCQVHKADVRVGGSYDFEMKPPEGEPHRVRGEYREVVANKKLVFTWAWVSTPDRVSLVTIDIKPSGSSETVLTLTHARFADTQARDRHSLGWTGCLDALEALIDNKA
ncbi:MAG: SRPBCC domain-containing protein [Alphaproteobacteria bacterium]|nr:SRPBCC domain-containing protein [Alphaproteobacteria bacterium]